MEEERKVAGNTYKKPCNYRTKYASILISHMRNPYKNLYRFFQKYSFCPIISKKIYVHKTCTNSNLLKLLCTKSSFQWFVNLQ